MVGVLRQVQRPALRRQRGEMRLDKRRRIMRMEPPRDDLRHARVPGRVGMEHVSAGVVEELRLRSVERIEPRLRIQVDQPRRTPLRSGLLDDVNVVADPQASRVRVRLVGLHVVGAESRVPAVDRRQEPDRHAGETAFAIVHHGGDAPAERLLAVCPVSKRHVRVEVVRAGEDDDLVDRVGMRCIQLLGLPEEVLELVSVDAVDKRHDPHVPLQEVPVVRRATDVPRVRDRIAQKRDSSSAPEARPRDGDGRMRHIAGRRGKRRRFPLRQVDDRYRPGAARRAHNGGRGTRQRHERDVAFGAPFLQSSQKPVQPSIGCPFVHHGRAPLQRRLDAVLVHANGSDRILVALRCRCLEIIGPAEHEFGPFRRRQGHKRLSTSNGPRRTRRHHRRRQNLSAQRPHLPTTSDTGR